MQTGEGEAWGAIAEMYVLRGEKKHGDNEIIIKRFTCWGRGDTLGHPAEEYETRRLQVIHGKKNWGERSWKVSSRGHLTESIRNAENGKQGKPA